TSIRAFASWNPFLAPNAPPPKAGVTEPNTPFFPSPLLANSLLTFNDTSEGDSAGTSVDVQAEAEERPVINPANQIQGNSFKLNVQSNGETKLGTNAKIWGDLTITNPVDGAPSSIANANSPTNSTLVGKLRSNTAVDRLDPSTNPTGTLVATDGPNPNYHTDNVQAAAELITYEPESGDPPQRTGENLTPIGTNDSPQASGKSPPAPSPSGAPSLPASSSSLEGGSYSTYFLKAIDSDSSIETSETPGVRQIFITDDFFSEQVRPTNSDTTAVDIKSSNFVNHTGDAKNLQLFYDGTRNININLDGGIPFSGLIYAPNAKVSLTGTGDFIGAMVGSRVFINNTGGVRLLHDIGSDLTAPTSKDLTDPTFVGEPAGPNQLSSSYSTGGGPYKIDSWQQVNTILVP
ncbi:MAG: hypothetical protein K8F91_03005, partial [Candidatus Obscuribacterales bacterium]|nr:hypothetical protein [Candidatus Obscuribacterales bacterium]